jgi:hypothetical protein
VRPGGRSGVSRIGNIAALARCATQRLLASQKTAKLSCDRERPIFTELALLSPNSAADSPK